MIGRFLKSLDTAELALVLTAKMRPGSFTQEFSRMNDVWAGPCLVGVVFDVKKVQTGHEPFSTRQYHLLTNVERHRSDADHSITVMNRYDDLCDFFWRRHPSEMRRTESWALANRLIRDKALGILFQRGDFGAAKQAVKTACRTISTEIMEEQRVSH